MEAEVKQVIKEKEYVHDNDRKEYASKGLAGTALGIAIGAGVLSLWGRGRGVGIGGGMPENVNINTVSDAISVVPVLLLPLSRHGRKVVMRLWR